MPKKKDFNKGKEEQHDVVESMTTEVSVESTTDPKAPKTGDAGLKPTTVDGSNVLKQKKIAEVISGGESGSAAPGGGMTTFGASYSGNDAKITGSLAATPKGRENARGDGRFGRKLEKTSSKLTEMTSEQIDVFMDGPKPLAENREAVQGALGTRRNNQTVRTKSKGKVPASEMYQRSLDILSRDRVLYGVGQILKSKQEDYLDSPLNTMIKQEDGTYEEGAITFKPRGNYVPKALNFTINNSGVVTDFGFDVDDLNIDIDDEKVLNDAAPHAKTHANQIEIQRRIMDDKAGDESVPGWSPLPRMIAEPNRTLSFLKDLEQDTGNVAYMAHRFASLSLSYQINRAGKDGNLSGEPIDEAFNAIINGYKDSDTLQGSVQNVLKDKNQMLKGSPALLIAAFDSLTKYKNKGIVLTHPNSLKQHLFKGQNFMGTLSANSNLVKHLEVTQAMGTLDGDYDGIRPVLIDENFAMTSPFDWNDLFSFTGRTAYDSQSLNNTHKPYIYGYSDHRANYYTVSHHFLLKGMYDWLSRHAMNLFHAVRTDDKDTAPKTFKVPIVYSATNISLWTFLVLAALSDVEKNRATSLRELIYYENNHGSVFEDLLPLKGYPTTAARSFTFDSIDEPIKFGTLSEPSALSWTFPEIFWAGDEVGDNNHVVLAPYYFNETSFTSLGVSTAAADLYQHNVSFPVVRSGIMLHGIKQLVDMDERQYRLSLDRMIYPIKKSVEYDDLSVYKYDAAGDGIPGIKFDLESLRMFDFLTVPRELGLSFVAPDRYVVPGSAGLRKPYKEAGWRFDMSYRAKIYQGDIDKGAPSATTLNPFDKESINVDRGQLFRQHWIYNFASKTTQNQRDPGFLMSIVEGLRMNASGLEGTLIAGKTAFNPFVKLGVGTDQAWRDTNDFTVVSFQKALWPRIQLMPFIINPWDAMPFPAAVGENGQKYDIFDFGYWFGLAGFSASNFDEDHYNRMDKQIQEGYQFVEDLYLMDTPLLK